MTIISSLVLGIVEGITEFLPISSTAHMEIAARLMGILQTDFVKTFEIVIQFGAILAVVVLYTSRIKSRPEIWKRVIAAFIPTGIIGFLLYKIIKNSLLGNFTVVVWALGIGGLIIILLEIFLSKSTETNSLDEIEKMSYKNAFIIGTVQAIAVIPGVSRSAATVMAGRVLGMSRKAIVEFSFLLAVPTMLAASGYELYKSAPIFTTQESLMLIVGFVAAFVAALLSVKWLMNFVSKRDFKAFGVYRIILAIVLIIAWR